MATIRVEGLPGAEVHLVILTNGRPFLRVGLDQPMIVGFDILRKAADYDPPAAWKIAGETGCKIIESRR